MGVAALALGENFAPLLLLLLILLLTLFDSIHKFFPRVFFHQRSLLIHFLGGHHGGNLQIHSLAKRLHHSILRRERRLRCSVHCFLIWLFASRDGNV